MSLLLKVGHELIDKIYSDYVLPREASKWKSRECSWLSECCAVKEWSRGSWSNWELSNSDKVLRSSKWFLCVLQSLESTWARFLFSRLPKPVYRNGDVQTAQRCCCASRAHNHCVPSHRLCAQGGSRLGCVILRISLVLTWIFVAQFRILLRWKNLPAKTNSHNILFSLLISIYFIPITIL